DRARGGVVRARARAGSGRHERARQWRVPSGAAWSRRRGDRLARARVCARLGPARLARAGSGLREAGRGSAVLEAADDVQVGGRGPRDLPSGAGPETCPLARELCPAAATAQNLAMRTLSGRSSPDVETCPLAREWCHAVAAAQNFVTPTLSRQS